MKRGFVYLTAVVDMYSRRIPAHRVSIALELFMRFTPSKKRTFDLACLGQSTPTKAAQFTEKDCVAATLDDGVMLSMNCRGAWRDNVFVECVWRLVKYEPVFPRTYGSVSTARADTAEYIARHNADPGDSSLEGKRAFQALNASKDA